MLAQPSQSLFRESAGSELKSAFSVSSSYLEAKDSETNRLQAKQFGLVQE